VAQGIEKFLSKNAREDRVDKFERLSKDQPKEVVREMEAALLKPDEIPDYIGEVKKYAANSDTTIKLVFGSQEDLELIGRNFNIKYYIEPCIADIKMLLDLCKAIEAGEIAYDRKSGSFSECLEKEAPVETPEKAPPVRRKLLRRS
jgi:hypothetical protein